VVDGRVGLLDERYDAVPDLVRARSLPSMQLVGSPRGRSTSPALRRLGVRLVGPARRHPGRPAQFSGSLPNVCALADLKLGRLLDTLDAWADRAGVDADPPQRFAPTEVPHRSRCRRASDGEIATIVWATGYRPRCLARRRGVRPQGPGRARRRGHRQPRPVPDRPAVPAPPEVHLIDGAAADARELADHLVGYLTRARRRVRRAS
jgi:putative flavoprotein involved in K+ transport